MLLSEAKTEKLNFLYPDSLPYKPSLLTEFPMLSFNLRGGETCMWSNGPARSHSVESTKMLRSCLPVSLCKANVVLSNVRKNSVEICTLYLFAHSRIIEDEVLLMSAMQYTAWMGYRKMSVCALSYCRYYFMNRVLDGQRT